MLVGGVVVSLDVYATVTERKQKQLLVASLHFVRFRDRSFAQERVQAARRPLALGGWDAR